MKNLVVIISVFFISSLNAQTFDGVFIGGDFQTCVNQFKAKGYREVNKFDLGIKLTKNQNNREIDLYVVRTPKSSKAYKVSVYLPKKTSWSSLLQEFSDTFEILVEKYGEQKALKTEFESPYYFGDGYELQAVRLEKCQYYALWETQNTTILLEISKFEQINIQYENDALTELKKREQAEINAKTF
jgi:hypothetical protein